MKTSLKNLFIVLLCVGLISCSDNSSGPDEPDPGEAPSVPNIERESTTPDLSVFENNNPSDESNSTFNSARNTVQGIQYIFATLTNFDSFLMAGSSNDVSFSDGVWEWTYSYEYESSTVEIRLTAEPLGDNEVRWNMYWTFDDGSGNSYDNALVLSGTVADGGSTGGFELYSPNSEQGEVVPLFEYSWEIMSETERAVTVVGLDESGSETGRIEYEMDKPEHTITITDPESDNIIIFWNADTQEGYIEEGSERSCWDENFENVPCS